MSSLFARKLELKPFRWYQEPAIPMFRTAVKEGHKKIVGQAPCGYGKTVVAAHLAVSSMQKGNKVLFACPRISLVDQTLESFEEQGINDIGILQANHKRTNPMCQLQIACFDTLYSRELPDFDFVILDEIHLADARMWKLMERWKIVLALTATPWKKGLGLHFSKLIVLSTIHDMLEYHEKDPSVGLVPVRGIGPNPELLKGVSDIKTGQEGDFQEKPAAAFMDKKEIIADVVETWMRTRQDGSHPGDRTFLFCPSRINAKNLQEAFQAQDIKFGYIDAFTSERSPIFKKFRAGEIQGIASVGCLSTGVDEDVRCIIDAALKRKESDIVQAIGRGMRPGPGKECIARDSLVLTQYGLVKIQDITLDHLVWDGVDFVHHKGAVCKGIKPVIEHDGIIATPDHEVMTSDGFQRIAEAKRRRLGIVTTGVGGNPVWFSENNFPTHGRWRIVSPSCRGRVFELWSSPLRSLLQHAEEAGDNGLPKVQPPQGSTRTEVALLPVHEYARQVSQPVMRFISRLRSAWNQVPIYGRQRSRTVDRGQPRGIKSFVSDRQEKQRWELRTREPSVVVTDTADEQYPYFRWDSTPADHRIQVELSPREVFRQNSVPIDSKNDGRGDSEALGTTFLQAEREVWDILSAGPLQRFTVNGKLVHNCLWLNDHTGNANRFGWFADIFHEKLDTTPPHIKGRAYEKEEATPSEVKRKQCKVCRAFLSRGAFKCSNCGNVMVVDDVVTLDGELVNLDHAKVTKKPKKERLHKSEEQAFYSGLIDFGQRRGFKPGWAANKFKERFGVWPRKLNAVPMTPRKAVKDFIEESAKRYRQEHKPEPQPVEEYQAEF